MGGGTELMSEGMYEALESLVGLIGCIAFASCAGRSAQRFEDEEGEADMHIEGRLEALNDDRFIAVLDDLCQGRPKFDPVAPVES